MFIRYAVFILSPVLLATAMGMGGEAAPRANGENARGNGDEFAIASELLPIMTHWDPEKIRELGDRLAELPDSVAAAALWMVAAAPASVDATRFYAMALSSPSPAIRGQAADILAAGDSAGGMRLLTDLLADETEPDSAVDIVAAIARQPERRAIPSLIAIVLNPETLRRAAVEAADHLRRLTRANISDSPTAWRDWWRDHSHSYE